MYSSCNVLPSLGYKREGKGLRLVSRFVEDGVLSDWDRAFSSRLYRCSLQASWKVASAPRKAWVLPTEAPLCVVCLCVCECGCQSVVAHRLAGCNLEPYCICLVVLIDSLSWDLCVFVCVCLSPLFCFAPPSVFGYPSVQGPCGPALVLSRKRNNTTT